MIFPSKTKMLINAGIKQVVFDEGYADTLAREMIAESGIEVVHFQEGLEVDET